MIRADSFEPATSSSRARMVVRSRALDRRTQLSKGPPRRVGDERVTKARARLIDLVLSIGLHGELEPPAGLSLEEEHEAYLALRERGGPRGGHHVLDHRARRVDHEHVVLRYVAPERLV